MPIRWNRRVGRRGKVSARIADWTASLAGTSYVASNNSGRIQVQLYDWTGAIQGAVTAAATFRGVIAAQLENWSANISGTRNRPPVWTPSTAVTINVTSTSPVGTVVVDLAAAGQLYATDPDGDALTFTAQNLPSWLTLVGSEIRVAQSLTIGASANVTATADDNPVTTFGISSATSIVAQSTLAKPEVNIPTTLASYNTTITRIADPATLVGGETGVGPVYSQNQAWNSDETLLLLYGDSGYGYVFDAASPYTRRTGRLTPQTNYYPADHYAGTYKWSPTQPRDLYYFGQGHNVAGINWGAFSPHNDGVLVRMTFAADFSATHTVVGSWPGYWIEKNPSSEELKLGDDGKLWVGVCLRDTSSTGLTSTRYYAFLFNVTDNVRTAWLDCYATAGTYEYPAGSGLVYCRVPDHITPTPKCDAAIIAWGNGTGRYLGKEKYSLVALGGDLNTGFIKQIDPTTGHADSFKDTAGNSWMVYANGADVTLRKASIDGAAQQLTVLLPLSYWPGINGGQHISGRQENGARDWALMGQYSAAGGPWVAMRDELILVYADSTSAVPHITRLCQHRSVYGSYSGNVFGTVNRSGTQAVFGSNWGGSTKDAYLIDLQPQSASTAIADAAAALAPGDWSAVNVVGASTISTNAAPYNRPPFVGLDPSAGTRNILDWPGKAMWDSQSGDWWYSGGGALQSQAAGGMTIVRYQSSTDTFRAWQGLTVNSDGIWYPYNEAHCFDAADIHVPTRRIYRRMKYAAQSGPVDGLGWFNVDTFASGVIPMPSARDQYWTVCVHDGWGSSGSVLSFGNAFNFQRYDIAAGTFSTVNVNSYPQEGGLSIYHAGYVYYTGGTLNSNLYRIAANGTITTLGTTPVPMSNSYLAASGAILSSLGNYIYAFCGDGAIRRYDPAGNSWSSVGSMPWRFAGTQAANSFGAGALFQSTVGKVITNPGTGDGVMLWISGVGDWQKATQTYLWKPT
jgi:hypothetical protein